MWLKCDRVHIDKKNRVTVLGVFDNFLQGRHAGLTLRIQEKINRVFRLFRKDSFDGIPVKASTPLIAMVGVDNTPTSTA